MEDLKDLVNSPWLLLRDFNEILYPSEVQGGDFVQSKAVKFSIVLDRYHLLDIGAVGSRYTWFCRCHGSAFVSKHLDKVLANVS